MSWFRRKPEPPETQWRLHNFKPKSDITAYELALIMANTWSYLGSSLSDGLYLPAEKTAEGYFRDEYGTPEMARHFEATDKVDAFPSAWF